MKKHLDRAAWHKPLVSIVVTHFNYADHVEDALLSILDQTHGNWECVVVDDASDPGQRERMLAIVAEIGHPNIRTTVNAENKGQLMSFFDGVDATRGQFVCLLDPDDRYAPTFLEEALAAHLNHHVYAPILTTDQYLVRNDEVIVGTFFFADPDLENRLVRARELPAEHGALHFYPHHVKGWLWTTSSALMFRRGALDHIRPVAPLPFRHSADAYLAQACHMLGGTLRLSKPLIYRLIHDDNAYIGGDVFSLAAIPEKRDGRAVGEIAAREARRAVDASGIGPLHVPSRALPPLERFVKKWRNSFRKRWNRLRARFAGGDPEA